MARKRSISDWGKTIWTTRDGTKLQWCQMTISHLMNTASFIERRAVERTNAAWGTHCAVQGEMAEYYTEQAIRACEEHEDIARYIAMKMRDYATWRKMKEAA